MSPLSTFLWISQWKSPDNFTVNKSKREIHVYCLLNTIFHICFMVYMQPPTKLSNSCRRVEHFVQKWPYPKTLFAIIKMSRHIIFSVICGIYKTVKLHSFLWFHTRAMALMRTPGFRRLWLRVNCIYWQPLVVKASFANKKTWCKWPFHT